MPRLKQWWWVLLALAIAVGLARLRLDVDVLDLLPQDEPTVQGIKLYQEHFANARELIITLRLNDADKAERLAGELASRLRLETNLVSSVSWQPPWMEQPAAAAELAAYLWFNQPPQDLQGLTNRVAPDRLDAVLADTRATLATSLSPMDIARRAFDPFDLLSVPTLDHLGGGFSAEQGQRMFGSADGTFRLVFVQARPDLASYQACSSWFRAIQAVVANWSSEKPERQAAVIRYTGRPAFVTEIAGSMRRDLTGSIIGTAVIIAALFWLIHRRWVPMLWLLVLLSLILLATLGFGGLLLGTVSVVSMGFAAVLLGLAVDYAVVHYQEAVTHPSLSVPEIRREISPSILWAAITTISAFLVLNLGGLPGLAQLGTLVAIGVALAALVMVVAFLPPLFPERRRAPSAFPARGWLAYLVPPRETLRAQLSERERTPVITALVATALLLACASVVLAFKRPGLDKTADALRPQQAEAEKALEEMSVAMGIPQNPLWLIVSGTTEAQVYSGLRKAELQLNQAVSNRTLSGYLLPTSLWPREEYQQSNRPAAHLLSALGPTFKQKALAAGFNTNALFLTDEMVRTWARAANSTGVFWPSNQMSQWLLNRFVGRADGNWLALGLAYPATNGMAGAGLAALSRSLQPSQILLSGWDLLGSTTLQRVRQNLWRVVLPMVMLVLLSLWLTFRKPGELLLGLGVLGLSGVCLLALMAVTGWSWNLLNLMALPLILGTGVDYGIFMQLALRRYGGDVRLARRSIGRALLLCGGTAMAGFGSLAWSSNAGMASLGRVCAVGIGANMLISVCLLPGWWSLLRGPGRGPPGPGGVGLPKVPNQPSSFYRAWLWRTGLIIGRYLPRPVLEWLCVAVAELYYRVRRGRRQIVIRNLLPGLSGDERAASKTAHALFRQFGLKLADLWRYESGGPVQTHFVEEGWEYVQRAREHGRGVLLVSPHLGNWEIGGPLLVKRKVPFVVITQAEPGDGLTEVRMVSRARWGVETLVIGTDAFAFIEVIKRLQGGATVALLIDRPPPSGAVTVELFGRPFRASVSAAELARASGCAVIGVTVVRRGDDYLAQILPEIAYDRQTLGTREARVAFTQQIMRALEPAIGQSLDQWFHFVPIWPEL